MIFKWKINKLENFQPLSVSQVFQNIFLLLTGLTGRTELSGLMSDVWQGWLGWQVCMSVLLVLSGQSRVSGLSWLTTLSKLIGLTSFSSLTRFGQVWTSFTKFDHISPSLTYFDQVWTILEKFGQAQNHSESFRLSIWKVQHPYQAFYRKNLANDRKNMCLSFMFVISFSYLANHRKKYVFAFYVCHTIWTKRDDKHNKQTK